MFHTTIVSILLLTFFSVGCRLPRTQSSNILLNNPMASEATIDLAKIAKSNPHLVASVCSQKLLVVFVGHADIFGEYYFPENAQPPVPEKERKLRRDLLSYNGRCYFQKVANSAADLYQAISRESSYCLDPGVQKVLAAQGLRKRGILLAQILDGPGQKDSKIATTFFSQDSATSTTSPTNHLMYQDKFLKTKTSDFELNVPKDLGTLFKLLKESGSDYGDGQPFSQTIYFFKGHGGMVRQFPGGIDNDRTGKRTFTQLSLENALKGTFTDDQGSQLIAGKSLDHHMFFDAHGRDSGTIVHPKSKIYLPFWTREKACQLQKNKFPDVDLPIDCKKPFPEVTFECDSLPTSNLARKLSNNVMGVPALPKSKIPQSNRNQGTKDQGTKDQGGKDQGGKDQGGKDQGGKDQGGKDQGGKDQGGKDQGGKDQGGKDQGGKDQGGKDQGGSNFIDQGFSFNGLGDQGGGKNFFLRSPIYREQVTTVRGRQRYRDVAVDISAKKHFQLLAADKDGPQLALIMGSSLSKHPPPFSRGRDFNIDSVPEDLPTVDLDHNEYFMRLQSGESIVPTFAIFDSCYGQTLNGTPYSGNIAPIAAKSTPKLLQLLLMVNDGPLTKDFIDYSILDGRQLAFLSNLIHLEHMRQRPPQPYYNDPDMPIYSDFINHIDQETEILRTRILRQLYQAHFQNSSNQPENQRLTYEGLDCSKNPKRRCMWYGFNSDWKEWGTLEKINIETIRKDFKPGNIDQHRLARFLRNFSKPYVAQILHDLGPGSNWSPVGPGRRPKIGESFYLLMMRNLILSDTYRTTRRKIAPIWNAAIVKLGPRSLDEIPATLVRRKAASHFIQKLILYKLRFCPPRSQQLQKFRQTFEDNRGNLNRNLEQQLHANIDVDRPDLVAYMNDGRCPAIGKAFKQAQKFFLRKQVD